METIEPSKTSTATPPNQPDLVDELYPKKASRNLAITGWALFDLAMTIFSINILSRYFALWVSKDNNQPDIVYSLAFSVSLALVAFSSPVLGTISDRAGKRLPYLFVVTVITIIATASIGFANNLTIGLILFVIANYAYQSTQVFYNALLATISRPGKQGVVSGIGQAVGYSGALIAVILTPFFMTSTRDNTGQLVKANVSAFVPTAVLITIFVIPIFFLMREPKITPVTQKQSFGQTIGQAFTQTIRSLQHASQYPNLFRFLLARLFYADAANTAVAFMSVYAANAIHMTDSQVTIVLAEGIIFAIVGAFGFGFVNDKIGPKRAEYIVLSVWAVAFIAAAVTQNSTIFFVIAALVGLGLGALRTTDRTFLIRVAPPAMIGEAFGLYGLVGEFSSILGPLLWGVITFVLESTGDFKYRAAIGSLLILLFIGWAILRTAQDKPAA